MTFLSAIILLGILIFIHELGHFIFAKLLGVRVLKFSLGFGPRLLGRKYGDTEYLISSIPLGGYIKMLGEEPGEELKEKDKPFAYNYQPVWKRLVIVFSGPFFNLAFAAFIFFVIFLSGIRVPEPYIGKIMKDSPAAEAGLMTGDSVIAINENPVNGWDDIDIALNENSGEKLLFRVERDGKIIELFVTPVRKTDKNIFGEDIEVWDIGITPFLNPVIGRVMKGTVAEKAGLKRGDRIIEIEGAVIKTWQDMTTVIHGNPGKSLRFKIKRNEQIIELTLSPKRETFITPAGEKKEIGLIGIKPIEGDFIKKFNPIDAMYLGIKKTWEISVFTVIVIIKLIQRIIPTETLGGPIMIFQMTGEQASLGAMNFFTFMAVISINLGVLNLLPIPILDGGHLMLLTIEAIRRKPLSERIMMIAQRVGLAIIITIMVFALYNDIIRLITGKGFPQ